MSKAKEAMADVQLATNFSLSEFTCKDGTPVPDEYMNNVRLLAVNLQVLRDHIGEPIHVNSGYRSPDYNKKVGGKKNSYHLKGMAADITCKSKSPKQLAAIIEKLIADRKMKQGGIGIYAGFIHYDVRGYKARW
jgi:Uncharacterized protein conserved in bacteria